MKALFVTIVVAIILTCNSYTSAQETVVAEKKSAAANEQINSLLQNSLQQSFQTMLKSLLFNEYISVEKKKEISDWKPEIKIINNTVGVVKFPKGLITVDSDGKRNLTLTVDFEKWATGVRSGCLNGDIKF